jgi:hypothetical protein
MSLDCPFLNVSELSILECLWIVHSWMSLDCPFLNVPLVFSNVYFSYPWIIL